MLKIAICIKTLCVNLLIVSSVFILACSNQSANQSAIQPTIEALQKELSASQTQIAQLTQLSVTETAQAIQEPTQTATIVPAIPKIPTPQNTVPPTAFPTSRNLRLGDTEHLPGGITIAVDNAHWPTSTSYLTPFFGPQTPNTTLFDVNITVCPFETKYQDSLLLSNGTTARRASVKIAGAFPLGMPCISDLSAIWEIPPNTKPSTIIVSVGNYTRSWHLSY